MASEYADPAAPQTQFDNTSLPNVTARIEPYTDRNITTRNVAPTVAVPTPQPPPSGSTTLGGVTVYDVAGTDHEPGAQGASARPHEPTAWRSGRDFYKNGGMVGQSFFNNPSN